MKVEWSNAALADLDRFAEFLHDKFPSLASIVGTEIVAKAEHLARNPRAGRALEGRKEYRQLVLRVLNAPYVLQYRYDRKRLVILRVWHGRENHP